MNCLLFRRLNTKLCLNYLTINAQNKQIISNKILRQLNTTLNHVFNETDLKPNKCRNEWQTIRRTISTSYELHLLSHRLNDNFLQQKRYKKGRKGSKRETKQEESDEESDAEEEQLNEFDADLIDGKAIDFKDIEANVVSLRLDNVLKAGLNIARSKVEEAFYNNMIRVNGERVAKKSVEIREDDEIDLIRGLNQDNPDLIDVARVVIKKVEDKMSSKDRVRTKLRRFRNLTIENYKTDPYDGFVMNVVRPEGEERAK